MGLFLRACIAGTTSWLPINSAKCPQGKGDVEGPMKSQPQKKRDVGDSLNKDLRKKT